MADILLLEPELGSDKYPPLGLMKLGSYHESYRGDFVWLARGSAPKKLDASVLKRLLRFNSDAEAAGWSYRHNIDRIRDRLMRKAAGEPWDRVYVATVFTFEWRQTVRTIEHAKSLVRDASHVIVGGIAATLMHAELESETGITPVKGQLFSSKMIGYEDNVDIDSVTPHYGLLDHVPDYHGSNAYYTYATRGCGMGCEFCAVGTLEPHYVDYIPLKPQIEEIDRWFGPRKDLILMDNNVLRSPRLPDIISDIEELGFRPGDLFMNPITKKVSRRNVDFNQGLDLYLINDKTARLLSRIALKPARIAFDHIEDKEQYVRAVELVLKYRPTEISNYLLYNTAGFSGKGRHFRADTPDDLYTRLRLNVDLRARMEREMGTETAPARVPLYSFPMRYIPLDAKTRRDYIGPNWDAKHLRAIQVMLNPSQGKGVSGDSFFSAAFGKDMEEFRFYCLMPEKYLLTRGELLGKAKKRDAELHRQTKELWDQRRQKWIDLYTSLDECEQERFKQLIADDCHTMARLASINDTTAKLLYLHYFDSPLQVLNLLVELADSGMVDDIHLLRYHLFTSVPEAGIEVVDYASKNAFRQHVQYLVHYMLTDILAMWCDGGFQWQSPIRLVRRFGLAPIDAGVMEFIQLLYALGQLKPLAVAQVRECFHAQDWRRLRSLLAVARDKLLPAVEPMDVAELLDADPTMHPEVAARALEGVRCFVREAASAIDDWEVADA